MARVAIVTDSAADLDPATANALGITVVPLIVRPRRPTTHVDVSKSRLVGVRPISLAASSMSHAVATETSVVKSIAN